MITGRILNVVKLLVNILEQYAQSIDKIRVNETAGACRQGSVCLLLRLRFVDNKLQISLVI